MGLFFITLCAFFAALLTLFSGFGLSTLLMPVAAIFFPVAIAIALTALVHLANNIFKLLILWKKIHWPTAWRFGLPAILGAFPGAWVLTLLANSAPLYRNHLWAIPITITPVKLVTGFLLILFATVEWFAIDKKMQLPLRWLPFGGLLSGFFGGLSGQQGAFRSAFLLRMGLSKEQFIGTNAAIAAWVDLARLIIYGASFGEGLKVPGAIPFIIAAAIAAFAGTLAGVVWLSQMTISFIQRLVALMLYILGAALCLGIL